ncbi:hypothetical protein BD410DRAFT_718982, partial [Rickenella mellea]
QLALSRTRLVTLVYGEMETIRPVRLKLELESAAKIWVNPPFDAYFALRIPTELGLRSGCGEQKLYRVDSQESYELATLGVTVSRFEIFSDAPPPPADRPIYVTFSRLPPISVPDCWWFFELNEGEHPALDVTMSSEDQDMSRDDTWSIMGKFTGELNIVHHGANHKMEPLGVRQQDTEDAKKAEGSPNESLPPPKQTIARCVVHILSPEVQYCDLAVTFSPHWTPGLTWPKAENVSNETFKYFLRLHSTGAMEHFESEIVTNALYYQAIADLEVINPHEYISPHNGFAMPSRVFISLIVNVLDKLGRSLPSQTDFMIRNIDAFAAHKNVAFRFLSQAQIADVIALSITAADCEWNRVFLLFRGVTDEDMPIFAERGEKEASKFDWKELVGITEASSDPSKFRLLETSVCEVV